MNENIKHCSCLVCKSKKLKPLKGYFEQHGLIKCEDCDFVFMDKIPTSDELEDHYSTYSFNEMDVPSKITVKRYNELLDEFEKYRKTNRLLDVGCGRGWFLMEAKKRNWEVYGTEYAKVAVDLCASRGINIKQGQLNSTMFENGEFDIITSLEVIEHINTPIKDINSISNLLRENGLFYCTTPNFDSLMRYLLKDKYNVIEYPEHLAYYTKATLRKLLSDQHFYTTKLITTGFSVSRIKASRRVDHISSKNKSNIDQVLIDSIEEHNILKLLRKFINALFIITNSGMIIKGYFIKRTGLDH